MVHKVFMFHKVFSMMCNTKPYFLTFAKLKFADSYKIPYL